VFRKSNLVSILDLGPLLLEFLIVGILLNFIEYVEILQVSKATSLAGDQLGQSRIGLVQPTSWGDSVGDVSELVRAENSDKVLENGGLDQI